MEIENFNLGFRDFIAYIIPGFFVFLWLYYIGILDLFEEEIATPYQIVLAIGIILGSYVLGQVIYPSRILLIRLLRYIFGDPRTELISKSSSKYRFKPLPFKIFFIDVGEFNSEYRSDLLSKLEVCWGKSLVNENDEKTRLAVYMLSLKFVRHISPHKHIR